MQEVSSAQKAAQIVSHWRTLEFLSQENLPNIDRANPQKRQLVLRDGENLYDELMRLQDADENERTENAWGSLTFYVGRVPREVCIAWLEQMLPRKDGETANRPERDDGYLACLSFQTDADGHYVEHSFSLSPVLWAIHKVAEEQSADFTKILSPTLYEEKIDACNKEILRIWQDIDDHSIDNDPVAKQLGFKPDDGMAEQEKSLRLAWAYAQEWLANVKKDMIPQTFPADKTESFTLVAYDKPHEEPDKAAADDSYRGLCNSFFLKDLDFALHYLNEKFRPSSASARNMAQIFCDYILAPYSRENEQNKTTCFDVVNGCGDTAAEKQNFLHELFAEMLDIRRHPLAKWPSQFNPALMQQVAINMAIAAVGRSSQSENTDKADRLSLNGPIFSVNGPPGTGKTTLLKEVIANNIVERAILIAQNYDKPDDAFVEKSFADGEATAHGYLERFPHYYALKNEAIARYGILVASCNNAAVENITKETPDRKKLLDDAPEGEISELFKGEQIYFSEYASQLLNGNKPAGTATQASTEKTAKAPANSAWGLVAAPLGKKKNLKEFDFAVLFQLLRHVTYMTSEKRAATLENYQSARSTFLEQLKYVEKLHDDIARACDAERSYRDLSAVYATTGQKLQATLLHEPALDTEIKALQDSIVTCRQNMELFRPAKGGFFSIFHKKTDAEKAKEAKFKELEQHEAELSAKLTDATKRKESLGESRVNLRKLETSLQIAQKEFSQICGETATDKAKAFQPLDNKFIEQMVSPDNDASTEAQVAALWVTDEYNRAREKLFFCAMRLMEAFILASPALHANLANLRHYWGFYKSSKVQPPRMSAKDKAAAFPDLLRSLFLLVPVISTTFASAERFLGDVREAQSMGLLIVDESGQATPQMAVGALLRSTAAMIVGDPKQIEPVVTDDLKLLRDALFRDDPAYRRAGESIQSFADRINHFGTVLSTGGTKEWVGSPLRVHRRCISPMYDISNRLSYGGFMRNKTFPPNQNKVSQFYRTEQLAIWFDVKGKEAGGKNHFVEAQAIKAKEIIDRHFATATTTKLYIISPFKSVVAGMRKFIGGSDEHIKKWAETNIGTVHTFQGKEAEEVIFLLGCDESSLGAVRWVNANIVNVAVTRAKFRLYVIGDVALWKNNENLKLLFDVLKENEQSEIIDVAAENTVQEKASPQETVTARQATPAGGTITPLKNAASRATATAQKSAYPRKTAPVQRTAATAKAYPCPRCQSGHLVKRTRRSDGKPFWGCNTFPDCRYTCDYIDGKPAQ